MLGRCYLVLGTMLFAAVAGADDAPVTYQPPDFLTATPPLPPNVDAAAVWRLDLPEALRVAVHQNLGVSLERRNTRVARLGITVAGGLFEPTLEMSYVHGSSRTPPSTSQEGMAGAILEFVDDRWRVALGRRLATGMRLSLEFNAVRSRSTLGTAIAPLNYRSTVSVSAVQPLLRGFSFDLTLPQLTVLQAQLASERQKEQLTVAITEIVERTEGAYWDVVAALYRYDLERRSHARAQDQLTLTRRQIDAGVTPPSDLIAAEATLAQRQLQLVQAEEAIGQAWDQLRSLLDLPREEWSRPILPVDPPTFLPSAMTPEEALTTAIAHRPELAQLELDQRQAQLSLRRAENDKLPQIDLGITGNVVGQDERYGPAAYQLAGFEARGWNVFVNMSWTPLRRATGAAAEIERTRYEMATTRREQLVQQIWLSVRNAVRNQRSAARQVAAASHSRELAEQSLDIEQRKFLNGTSSNFFVAQRQQEVAAAQLSELTAVLGHRKAATSLARATGRLLEERNIELGVR